ncbi:MAG: peroxiredoxin family protein [Hyphococcus sp.]
MNFLKGLAGAIAAISMLSTGVAENAAESGLGPAVGATIPHDLQLQTANGDQATFEELVGETGMALFFIRSVDWCPYCQAQAIEVDSAAADFAERGLSVVFLSYDSPEEQREFIRKRGIQSVLLSDEDSEVIDAFGLRNENYEAGSRAYGVPHPAVFFIKPDKTIVAKLYEDDFLTNAKSYRNRPAVSLVLETADQAFTSSGA